MAIVIRVSLLTYHSAVARSMFDLRSLFGLGTTDDTTDDEKRPVERESRRDSESAAPRSSEESTELDVTVATEEEPAATSTATMDGLAEEQEVFEFERFPEFPYNHHTNATWDVRRLLDDEDDDVEDLLLWCIAFTEAEARSETHPETEPVAEYYDQLATVYRSDDRYEDELELLERYADVCEELDISPDDDLVVRLDRARQRVPAETQSIEDGPANQQ